MTDDTFPCGHATTKRGCGGCDPSAIEFVITDDGERRPFDPARDMTTEPTTHPTPGVTRRATEES